MKRAYRERAMNRLCADLASADFDVREHALFQLALMLRRSQKATQSADWTDYDSEHLSRELLRIRLSLADQERIVSHLARLVSTHTESRASAFWVLSEVSAQVGFATVSSLIAALGHHFSDEAAFQACRTLSIWLESEDIATRQACVSLTDPAASQVVRRWSRSTEVRLAKRANHVIELAQRLSA